MSVARSTPDPGAPYDLGILLISGNQRGSPSAGLRELNDTLLEWFLNRKRWEQRLQLIECATRDVALEQGEAPPHAELRLTKAKGEGVGTHRWLLVESHVDNQLTGRDARAFLRWLLWILPFFVVDYLFSEVRRTRRMPGPGYLRWFRSLPSQIGWAAAGLLELAVVALLLLLLFAQTLRIPLAAKLSIAVGSRLERLLGASYLQVTSATAFEALVTKVEADLGWLCQRSRRVAIIAPSFGVPIAHQVVHHNPDQVDLFVTVGSTLRKVLVARQLDHDRRYEPYKIVLEAFFFVMLSLVRTVLLAYSLESFLAAALSFVDGEWALGLPELGFGALVLSVVMWSWSWSWTWLAYDAVARSREAEEEIPLPAFRGTWLSFVASGDAFVGEPFRERSQVHGPHRIDVVNQASPLSDHREYLRNIEEVTTPLAHALLRTAGPPFDLTYPKRRLDRAIWRRRFRIPWLVRLRWAAAVTGLLTAIALAPAIANWLDINFTKERVAVLGLPGGLAEIGEALFSRAGVVFAIIWTIAGLLLYQLYRTAWNSWETVDRFWALYGRDRSWRRSGPQHNYRVKTSGSFGLVLLWPTVAFTALLALNLDLLRYPFARFTEDPLWQLVLTVASLLFLGSVLIALFTPLPLERSQRWLRFRIKHITAPMLQLVLERLARYLTEAHHGAGTPELVLNGTRYRLLPEPRQITPPPEIAMTLARDQVMLMEIQSADTPAAPDPDHNAVLRPAQDLDWADVRRDLPELAPFVGISEALSAVAILGAPETTERLRVWLKR